MKRAAWVAAAGVCAVLPLVLYLRGFLVDDAFISARYAANIASGHGYRFNVGGPVTDGVTPLGFAYVLAPYAGDGVLGAFRAAKVLGAVMWCVAAAMIALAIDSIEGSRAKWIGLVLIATSAPLAAWSVAGMETGIVLGLAGVAAASRALRREVVCCVAAAVVGAWRPEAIPWALAMALAPARATDSKLSSRWPKLGIVVAPAACVAAIRWFVFGHAMPLAAIAKPSTVRLGAMYALACAILCGFAALLAVRRVPSWVRGLQAAVVVHWLAMALAGGDWMPVSRLATTALPTLAVAAAAVAARANEPAFWGRAWLGLRNVAAVGGQLFVLISHGPNLADTERERFLVVDAFRAHLQRAKTVATLDIGWVGATTSATVVDLAGVTDPEIAVLKGGHTSKRIPTWLFEARNVDTLVVRLRRGESVKKYWYQSRFATFVDMWVATTPSIAEGFVVVATHDQEPRYVLLKRVP